MNEDTEISQGSIPGASPVVNEVTPEPVVVTVQPVAAVDEPTAPVVPAAAPEDTLETRMKIWAETFAHGVANSVEKGIKDADTAVKAFEAYFHKS